MVTECSMRLHRIGKIKSSDCLYCPGITDTTSHLLSCSLSSQVACPLLNCLRSYKPDITAEDITILKIPSTESLELPMSWLLSACLSYIWDKRLLGKQAMLNECRADLISKMNLLRDTKWNHYRLHSCVDGKDDKFPFLLK